MQKTRHSVSEPLPHPYPIAHCRNTVVQQQAAIEVLKRELALVRRQLQPAGRHVGGAVAVPPMSGGGAGVAELETPRLLVRPQGVCQHCL